MGIPLYHKFFIIAWKLLKKIKGVIALYHIAHNSLVIIQPTFTPKFPLFAIYKVNPGYVLYIGEFSDGTDVGRTDVEDVTLPRRLRVIFP